jgi:Transposase
MISRLRRAGAGEVAIERGDGVLAGALLAAGLTVVVITPGQVKNLRSRYGSSGAKDDRFDSFVLAVAFPAVAGLFYEPDSPISLAYLARFGCHDAAARPVSSR